MALVWKLPLPSSAPLGLGLLWSAQSGYSTGLWVLLGLGVAGALTLHWAQRLALNTPTGS